MTLCVLSVTFTIVIEMVEYAEFMANSATGITKTFVELIKTLLMTILLHVALSWVH